MLNDARGPLSLGTVVHERYRITAVVGRGGLGTVYQGTDILFGRNNVFALKELVDQSPGARRQFEQEAQWLEALDHNHIPKVREYFEWSQRLYLVMDFVEGENLEQKLIRAGGRPLPEFQVLSWILPICDALEYLHTRVPPILHRDVKPANIIVTSGGHPVLVDLGIAKQHLPGANQTNTFVRKAGTEGYAPPEQYSANAQTGPWSDVYGLGATLYQLLTAQIPPSAVDRVAMDARLKHPRELNPTISPQVDATIVRALALRPVERYARITEVAAALRGQQGSAPPGYALPPDSGMLDQLTNPSGPFGGAGGRAPAPPAYPPSPASPPSGPNYPPSRDSGRLREAPQRSSFTSPVPSVPQLPRSSKPGGAPPPKPLGPPPTMLSSRGAPVERRPSDAQLPSFGDGRSGPLLPPMPPAYAPVMPRASEPRLSRNVPLEPLLGRNSVPGLATSPALRQDARRRPFIVSPLGIGAVVALLALVAVATLYAFGAFSPSDRSTPQAAVTGYFQALSDQDYSRAWQFTTSSQTDVSAQSQYIAGLQSDDARLGKVLSVHIVRVDTSGSTQAEAQVQVTRARAPGTALTYQVGLTQGNDGTWTIDRVSTS